MPQIKKSYSEVRIPLANMTFAPDVPTAALGANEYNKGLNIETDVRGIRQVNGDEHILTDNFIPGTPTYISGGFRQDGQFWTIVATVEGYWYAKVNGTWIDITPVNGPYQGYSQSTNITEAWNGTVPFFNDEQNPPMFWAEATGPRLALTGSSWSAGTVTLTFDAQPNIPFVPGDFIMAEFQSRIPYNGIWYVTASTNSSVSFTWGDYDYISDVDPGYVQLAPPKMTMYSNQVPLGIATITYINSTTQRVTYDIAQPAAPFVAGETIVIDGVNSYFDGQWQVTAGTTTYCDVEMSPTVVYPGNSVGSIAPLYSWNYNPEWKSVSAKFMRLYNTPNVGTILVAGNLTAINQTDDTEYYPVTVAWSQAFGLNEAPITWAPTLSNVANQLEVPLRGAAVDAFETNGQLYLSSYWDTVVFSPINYATTTTPILGVRLLSQNHGQLTSNCSIVADGLVYGVDAHDIWVFNGNQFKSIGNQRVKNWFFDDLDSDYADRVFMAHNTSKNQIEIYYPTVTATNGVPNRMLSYRYDIDCWNAPREVESATFACETPVRYADAYGNWQYNPASRKIMYVSGLEDENIVQKDTGYSFTTSVLNPTGTIVSLFRRNNIRLTKDYSTETMIHRVLPEFVNLDATGVEIDPAVDTSLIGTVDITVEGQASVGAATDSTAAQTIASNTQQPWIQINQNSYRVSNLEIASETTSKIWLLTGITYQFTETEDDR